MQGLFGFCLCLLPFAEAARTADYDADESATFIGALARSDLITESNATAFPVDLLAWAFHAYWAKVDVQELLKDLEAKKALLTLATRATLDFETLVEELAAEGEPDTKEILQSQYLQIEQVRASFRSIREVCSRPVGLVHWLAADPEWENVSVAISEKVTEVEESLEIFVNALFCGRFEALVENHLGQVQVMVTNWELASGQTWFPERSVPNTAIRVDRGEDGTGLTEEDVNYAHAQVYNEDWTMFHTIFSDKLLDDEQTSNETKAAFQSALREVALLFPEMLKVSPECGDRARALRDRVSFCSRAGSLCDLPSSKTSILAGLQSLLKKHPNVMNHVFDVWAALTPRNWASSIHLAQRLLTIKGPRRLELCKTSLRVLSMSDPL